MKMFGSEADLVTVLDEIEGALERAAQGPAEAFREHYFRAWDLYGTHAVDGHESDEAERGLLAKHANRISRLERALESAGGICSEEDAVKEIYQNAGRYGATEAVHRVRLALEFEIENGA